jgi:hypothetical protein
MEHNERSGFMEKEFQFDLEKMINERLEFSLDTEKIVHFEVTAVPARIFEEMGNTKYKV